MDQGVSKLKRVLFVCVENSNRSQIAEAFARIHGYNRVEAYSAGSRPAGQINPRAIEFMRERGYDLTRHKSKSLLEIPFGDFDVRWFEHGAAKIGPFRIPSYCPRINFGQLVI